MEYTTEPEDDSLQIVRPPSNDVKSWNLDTNYRANPQA